MVRFTGRFAWFLAFLIVAAVLLSSPASAQTRPPISSAGESAIGFQGGVSIDPEQGFVGVFYESPQIANRFSIRPGVDGGFGSDLRVATINIDFLVRFPLGNSSWSFTQGGGPVIVITKVPALELTDTTAGFNYILGFAQDSGFFTEFRLGSGNVPTLKIAAGYRVQF